jgi:hypothetical protein
MSKKLSTLNMKKIIITIFILFTSVIHAQSNLPACNGNYSGACFGKRIYDTGDYVGEFLNGLRNGQGIYSFANGEKYVGQYRDNKRTGQGTYTWSDGEKYVGQWRDGKQNGLGTYTFSSGNKYVGQFRDDKRTGQGTFTYANGDKYVGQYIDGKMNGQGTFTFADGEKYVGQFKDDSYDGFGTLYYPNGSIFQQGLWRDNKFIQAQNPAAVSPPVVPKPLVNNAQDIKRQKCIRLGLAPGSADFQQCMN